MRVHRGGRAGRRARKARAARPATLREALERLARSSWGQQGTGSCPRKATREKLLVHRWAQRVKGQAAKVLSLTPEGWRALEEMRVEDSLRAANGRKWQDAPGGDGWYWVVQPAPDRCVSVARIWTEQRAGREVRWMAWVDADRSRSVDVLAECVGYRFMGPLEQPGVGPVALGSEERAARAGMERDVARALENQDYTAEQVRAVLQEPDVRERVEFEAMFSAALRKLVKKV